MSESEKDIWRKETLRRVKETTKNSEKILQMAAETRRLNEESMKETQKLEERWKEFQDKFDKSMKILVEKIADNFNGLGVENSLKEIGEKSRFKPQKLTAKKAGKLLKDKKNVVILTGAGLSAASGIPTFRGNDGLWTKKYKHCTSPEDLATLRYFKKYPEIKWEWIYDFLELIQRNKPNDGHLAIIKYQEYCEQNGIKWTLITQNIDNYHAELLQKSDIIKTEVTEDGGKGHGFTNGVWEIHGNLLYMRWFKEWWFDLYTIPPRNPDLTPEEQIPKWSKWDGIMRPHILWFDETYTDELHKLNVVRETLETDVDALIVVGTALATTLAFKIVKECLSKDILTIDVNIESVCTAGNSIQIKEKAEIALPDLLSEFI